MQRLLESVIATLDRVEVRGRENMDLLLGCIITLEKLAKACKTTVEEKTLEGARPDDSNGEGENICSQADCTAGSAE